MNIAFALALFLFAGIIHGSFAISMKYMRGWVYENIWFQWSFLAFLILPWLFILIITPQVFEIYAVAPASFILIMVVTGIFFGIGQICFAYALHSIGISLGFVLNIGIAAALGSMLPLIFQYPDEILTPFGMLTITGVSFVIIGLILCAKAGNSRDGAREGTAEEEHTHVKKVYWAGITFGVIAGVSGAVQNFGFSETEGLQEIALEHGATKLGADNIFWPGFLLMAFIPFAAYMFYLFKKNNTFGNYALPGTRKYFLFGPIMGGCWIGSFILYSKASEIIGELGPVVGWPLFMIIIILISNFWGHISKEWEGVDRRVAFVMFSGLVLLVVAVVNLAIGGYLR